MQPKREQIGANSPQFTSIRLNSPLFFKDNNTKIKALQMHSVETNKKKFMIYSLTQYLIRIPYLFGRLEKLNNFALLVQLR